MTCDSCSPNPCRLFEETNIRDKSVEMMRLTNEMGVEHGLFIVRDNGRMLMTPIQRGSKHSIRLTHPFGEPVATVHTHPSEAYESLFSIQDTKALLDGRLEFAASIFDDNGDVFADVFTRSGFSSFDEARSNVYEEDIGHIELVKRINDEVHECKVNLGEL